MKKLADILGDKSFYNLIDFNKKVDINSLLELFKQSFKKCKGYDFKIENNSVKCLNMGLYISSPFLKLKREIRKHINKLSDEQINLLLEWDEYVLLNIIPENKREKTFLLLLPIQMPKNIIEKNQDRIAEILTKYIKNMIGKTEGEIYGLIYEEELPVIEFINKFICDFENKKVIDALIEFIMKSGKKYIEKSDTHVYMIGEFNYECFMNYFINNNIEFNKLMVKYFIVLFETYYNHEEKLLNKFLKKICNDIRYEEYWDDIKEKFKEYIKSDWWCYDIMDMFDI